MKIQIFLPLKEIESQAEVQAGALSPLGQDHFIKGCNPCRKQYVNL